MSQPMKITDHLEGDRVIWAIAILLSLASILVVYSAASALAYRSYGGATEYVLLKHTLLVGVGLFAMYLCHKVPYQYYSRLSRLALLASVPLLLITWQFGTNLNEASRWLSVPFVGISFQPSDLARLALITNIASMLSKRQMTISNEQSDITPMMTWTGIICALIGLTDWSGATLLFATCMLLLFIGRVPAKYLGMMLVVGVLAGMFSFTFGQRGETVSSRLRTYLSDSDVPFQAEQAYIALASGGLTGTGAGKSIQRNFLPHPYSDFIFAIIVEEYGLMGALVILSLFLVLLYRGMVTASHTRRAFGGLLAAGLTFSLVVQALVNMSVVVGVLPVTGLPLPLLSMGGTSLLFTGMTLGMILSVSRTEKLERQEA